MPAITAALVEATVGQRLNPNRAWQPFAHAPIIGEHKAKVNSNLQFLRLGTSSIARSGAGDMEERGRALETFVEEWKHEQELEAN
jgi:hypothetical protein